MADSPPPPMPSGARPPMPAAARPQKSSSSASSSTAPASAPNSPSPAGAAPTQPSISSASAHTTPVKGDGKEEGTAPASAYKVPPKTELKAILAKDSGDKSLERMKKQLIGESPFPDDPRKIIVKQMELRVVGEEPIVVDAKDSKSNKAFNIKEGSNFTLALVFWVQHDIVMGLKCVLKVKRLMVTNTEKWTVGSYGPKMEPQEWHTEVQEAPSGFLAQGKYHATLTLTDDDGQEHLSLPYDFNIVKA